MTVAIDNKLNRIQGALRITWKGTLDHLIFVLLLIMAVMPMARIPWVGGGRGVNVQVPLEALITIALAARILMVGADGKPLPLFLFSLVLAVYSAFSIAILNVPLNDVIFHLQLILPFFIACLFWWAGISIHPKRLLFGLSVAIGISGLMSLYLFYFAPQVVLSTYADSREEYAALIAWGRNFFWFNLPAVYFPWVAFLSYRGRSKVALGLLYGSVISSVFGMISLFSRGQLLAYALLVFITIMGGASYRLKRIMMRLSLISGVVLGLFYFYYSYTEKTADLLGARIVPLISQGTSAIPAAHISVRTSLFDQYLENFARNPVFGVGLGVPFATDPVDSFYTDVTIVSFGVTFGVVGLFVFGLFVFSVWHSLANVRNEDLRPVARLMTQLMIVALLLSLNDNIWMYKPFAIYFAAVTASISYFGKSADVKALPQPIHN